MNQPDFLSLEDVIVIHQSVVETYGGQAGLRDLPLLKSAVAQPRMGYGDEFYHKDVYEMAAAYLYHLVTNHPFVDGNKLVGLATADIFLQWHHIELKVDQEEAADFVLAIANSEVKKEEVAPLLRKHSEEI